MRLLQLRSNGDFSLVEFFSGNLPRYAILSHTWGENNDEFNFEDIQKGTGKNKPGYKKLLFCEQQAKKDGLSYFWIDTCCIDKSSTTELSEAINSMYRWYRDAEKCYAYLSDVSSMTNGSSRQTRKEAFRKSRWFTRGWTLQELLAPTSIEFFSVEGEPLGERALLLREISDVTGIPGGALQGRSLFDFSIDKRLSWASKRETKREEDKAYSLFGIFDVQLPLIYGEGRQKAWTRLLESITPSNPLSKGDEERIQHLGRVDPCTEKKRIEETYGLVENSHKWILETSTYQRWETDQKARLLLVKGDPGMGKTMLLCGIVNELEKSVTTTDLLCYFFCQSTNPRLSSAPAVLQGLVYLLIEQKPSLLAHFRDKCTDRALFEDDIPLGTWAQILVTILQDSSLNSIFIVIDAVDECNPVQSDLLDFLVHLSNICSRVKLIISCRSNSAEEEHIEKKSDEVAKELRATLDLDANILSTPIDRFIRHKISHLTEKKKYKEKTQEEVSHYLSAKANGSFLWVSLVCQSLESVDTWKTTKRLDSLPPRFESLYEQAILEICKSDDDTLCQKILATTATAYRPLTFEELSSLLDMSEDFPDDIEPLQVLINRHCKPFLTVREGIIYLAHQSAKEFLLASELIFPSGREKIHSMMFQKSLQAMRRTLASDIFSLHELDYPTSRVEAPDPDPLAALRYSCTYWIDHFCDTASTPNSHVDPHNSKELEVFIKSKYLHWLEALSLCRSVAEGKRSIAKLEEFILDKPFVSETRDLIQDANRFIESHHRAIERNPLQAYISALVFDPDSSKMRQLFHQEVPKWIRIKPVIESSLHENARHQGPVSSLAFCPDLIRLATGSDDGTIKIWDTENGECLRTLIGHRSSIKAVVFSPVFYAIAPEPPRPAEHPRPPQRWPSSPRYFNGPPRSRAPSTPTRPMTRALRLATSSTDRTVKIWDALTGDNIQTIAMGRTIENLSFTADGATLNTNIGTIPLNGAGGSTAAIDERNRSAAQPFQYQSWAISSNKEWITYNSKNLIWLPPEYRPLNAVVEGNMIGVGVKNGRVWICYLDSGFLSEFV